MHVSNIFHLWLNQLMMAWMIRKLQDIERNSKNRWFRQGVEAGNVRATVVNLKQMVKHYLDLVE